jgi:hypothetical protein
MNPGCALILCVFAGAIIWAYAIIGFLHFNGAL